MVDCVVIFVPEPRSVLILSRTVDMAAIPDLIVTCGDEVERLISWIPASSGRQHWLAVQVPWPEETGAGENRVRVRSVRDGDRPVCDARFYADDGLGGRASIDLVTIGARTVQGRYGAHFDVERLAASQALQVGEAFASMAAEYGTAGSLPLCLGFIAALGKPESGGASKVGPVRLAWPADGRRDALLDFTWWIDRVPEGRIAPEDDTPLRHALRGAPHKRLELKFSIIPNDLSSGMSKIEIETAVFVFHISRSGAALHALARGGGLPEWRDFAHLYALISPTDSRARYPLLGEPHTHEELGFRGDDVVVDFANVRDGDVIAIIADPARIRLLAAGSDPSDTLWYRVRNRISTNEHHLVAIRPDEVDDGSAGFDDIVRKAEEFASQAFEVTRYSVTSAVRKRIIEPLRPPRETMSLSARVRYDAPSEFDVLSHLCLQASLAEYGVQPAIFGQRLVDNHVETALAPIAARAGKLEEFAAMQTDELRDLPLAAQASALFGRPLPQPFDDPITEALWIAGVVEATAKASTVGSPLASSPPPRASRSTGRRRR